MIHADNTIHVTQIIDPQSPGAIPQDATDADLTDGIIADLRIGLGAMKCAMSERLVRLGISMAQLHIMHTLQRSGEMTMSQLADQLAVSLSNATGLVDRLEERGYVERRRVPEDRRVVVVRVTDLGARTLQESDALNVQLMRDVMARLDPDELPAIAHAVAEVRAALEATATQHAPHLHEPATPSSSSR
jgi:DNA-binding MarR family transcriptional regulator